jgi:hypothetical protein
MENIQTLPIEKDSMASTELAPGLAFDEAMLRQLGYQVMDEVALYLSRIRERPVWQPMPDDVHRAIREQELPAEGQPFEEMLAFIKHMILPFPLSLSVAALRPISPAYKPLVSGLRRLMAGMYGLKVCKGYVNHSSSTNQIKVISAYEGQLRRLPEPWRPERSIHLTILLTCARSKDSGCMLMEPMALSESWMNALHLFIRA